MRCVYNAASEEENRLINMNARLYDPVIGRFISLDPYVQNPYFSQCYNRSTQGLIFDISVPPTIDFVMPNDSTKY